MTRDALAAGESPLDGQAVGAAVLAEERHATAAASGRGHVCGEQIVQHRHPDGEPGAHLLQDQRVRRVGDAPVDLDASIDRAGMHHLLAGADALRRDPPARGVLPQARHVRRLHALPLHPQHVDDVGRLGVANVGRRVATERLDAARKERRRSDEGRVRADQSERLDERACDTAVEDVADDRDMEALQVPESVPHREEVEERLGRVLALAVAGVDDRRAGIACGELRRPDLRVANDDCVRVVRRQRQQRVLERLALVQRRAGRLQRHHVRGELLRGELEARRGPRRRLEEEVEHELALQRRQLLLHTGEGAGGLEDSLDVGASEVGNGDQMPHFASSGVPTSRIRSAPSISSSSTWIRSLRAVGRFLPT